MITRIAIAKFFVSTSLSKQSCQCLYYHFRSPNEASSSTEYPAWTIEKIKSALDIGDEDEADDHHDGMMDDGPELSPFVPTSPGELVLAFALAVPSILFMIYLSIVCYRFICSKNYARWDTVDTLITAVCEQHLISSTLTRRKGNV